MSSQVQPYHDFDNSGKPQNGNNGKNYFPANGNGHAPAPADTGVSPADTPTLDSSQLGFAPISNYFSLYWTRILGAKPALLYERIFMHAYGKKTSCFPSIELLAAVMGVARGTLTGRQRVNKETKVKGHKEGFLEILKRYGLITMHRRGKSYEYQPVKTLPLLNEQQIKALPLILRKRHEKDVARLKGKQEKQVDTTRIGVTDTTRIGVTDTTRIGVTNHTNETYKKNHTEKAEREVAKINKKSAGEEGTDFVAAIHSFYQQQGDEISSDKIGIEVRKLTQLRNQYSDKEILFTISWLFNNRNRYPRIKTIGGFLPHVIEEAVTEKRNREIRNKESTEYLRKMEQLEKEKLERWERFVGPRIELSILTERARAKKATEQKEHAGKLAAFMAEHRQKKQQDMEIGQEQATMT